MQVDDEQLERLLAALAAEPDPPTTVRSPAEVRKVHVADSLSALEIPAIREARLVADIGAGAGFPGLALALALPAAKVDLIEASRRKCEVIERLVAAAGIANATAVSARVEEWATGERREAYDVVTARAVGPLPVLAEYAAPLLRDGGALVAWKGACSPEEAAAGDAAAALLGLSGAAVLPVRPFPDAHSRHLYLYYKERPTPPGFPRRPGRAAKRPLA